MSYLVFFLDVAGSRSSSPSKPDAITQAQLFDGEVKLNASVLYSEESVSPPIMHIAMSGVPVPVVGDQFDMTEAEFEELSAIYEAEIAELWATVKCSVCA